MRPNYFMVCHYCKIDILFFIFDILMLKRVLEFLVKDYPAYFWAKPSLRRVLMFPLLLVAIVIQK